MMQKKLSEKTIKLLNDRHQRFITDMRNTITLEDIERIRQGEALIATLAQEKGLPHKTIAPKAYAYLMRLTASSFMNYHIETIAALYQTSVQTVSQWETQIRSLVKWMHLPPFKTF